MDKRKEGGIMINVYEPANGFSYNILFEANSPLQKIIINDNDGTINKVNNTDGNFSNLIIKKNGVEQYNGDGTLFTPFSVTNGDRLSFLITKITSSSPCEISIIAFNHDQDDQDFSVAPIATNAAQYLFVFNAIDQTIELFDTSTDTLVTTYDTGAMDATLYPRCGAMNTTDNYYYILLSTASANNNIYWSRINMNISDANFLDYEDLAGNANSITTTAATGFGGGAGTIVYDSTNDIFITNFNNSNPFIILVKHNYSVGSYVNSTITISSFQYRCSIVSTINNSIYCNAVRFSLSTYPTIFGDRIGSSLFQYTSALEDTLYNIRNSTGNIYYKSDLNYNLLATVSGGVHTNGLGKWNCVFATDNYVVCCIPTSSGASLGNNSGGFNIFNLSDDTFVCSIGIAVALMPAATGYGLGGFCFTGNKIYCRTQKVVAPAPAVGGNSLFVLDLDTLDLSSSRVLSATETGFDIIAIGEGALAVNPTESYNVCALNK